MGFTPLEGVMMGTRSGSVDPGLLLYLERQHGKSAADLEADLNQRSGLLGVSGVSADLRQVLEAADSGNARARLAYGIFVHTLRRAVGAMAGVLGGIDALAFTGGIGEHSARVREEVSAAFPAVRTLVIAAREDLSVLAEMQAVLKSEPSRRRSPGRAHDERTAQ